jgi:hypothetical protein
LFDEIFMHGLIFLQFQRFAQKQGCLTDWEDLLQEARLPVKSYSPARAYPDEEMQSLVQAAGRHLNVPEGAVLEAFGEFLAPELIRLYGRLIDPEWKTLDLVENTEKLIHTAVRVGNPGAQPPVLDCVRSTRDELQMVYSSDRRWCRVAKGIVKGIARHYGETVDITDDACMLRGDPFCALQVTRVAAAETITHAQAPLETAVYFERIPHTGSNCASGINVDPPQFLKQLTRRDEPIRLADFRLVELIGHGSMGLVYRAVDTRLDRVVALKIMQPRFTADVQFQKRFMREARAMAALKSDHVVTVYEVGVANELPFLAMEFLEGETLDSYQEKTGRLDPSEAVRIGKETAQGLAAAHARGLVHRDLKPSNLWLEAPTGRVKVLDFGLARLDSDSHSVSQVGAIVGTPAFMAPEQARGEAVDHRADLFSLGCVLYWLCLGQVPFKGTDVLSTLSALATEQPEPPHALSAEVPPELSELIMHLLNKDPSQRPASSQTVINKLAAIECGLGRALARSMPRLNTSGEVTAM